MKKKYDLKNDTWFMLLSITDNYERNIERVAKVEERKNETLEYVLKTLKYANNDFAINDARLQNIMLQTLSWSEVAKAGSSYYRKLWESKGYDLNIHNIASAHIYEDMNENAIDKDIISLLIRTHGLIGQTIRGEIDIMENAPLNELVTKYGFSKDDAYLLLFNLNQCILAGVSMSLCDDLCVIVSIIVKAILDGDLANYNYSTLERVQAFAAQYEDVDELTASEETLYEWFFAHCNFWYIEYALKHFTRKEIFTIFSYIKEYLGDTNELFDISFKPLANFLYYDYEGKKHVNIFNLRIVQKYLENVKENNSHIKFDLVRISNCGFENHRDTILFSFKLIPACEKLIDFCIEAERTNLVTYNQSIMTLFDLFGFRKDNLDRLNNETKYLDAMNEANSSKKDIVKYIVGKNVLDVGSGGGVMLDTIEKAHPNKKVYGCDISSVVIENLNKKKKEEKHTWEVFNQNLTYDNSLYCGEPFDTIVFSSILHEVYSYTDYKNGKFDLDAVKDTLRNAYNMLNYGGRLVIRDGVKTDSDESVIVEMKTPEGFDFAKKFFSDFKGCQDCDRDIHQKGTTFIGNINFIREMLFTYTWGVESYSQEVNEQFGYFTLREYEYFLEKVLGAKIIEKYEILEDGYVANLSNLVTLRSAKTMEEIPLPNSNLFIVAEKI